MRSTFSSPLLISLSLLLSTAACNADSSGNGDETGETGATGTGTETGGGDGDPGDGDPGDGDPGDGDPGDGDPGDGDPGDGDPGDGDGDPQPELGSVDRQVEGSNNDAEENMNQQVTIDSSDLELVDDFAFWGGGQLVGMRFQDVTVPANATITAAYLEFTVDEPGDQGDLVEIRGEANANPDVFTTAAQNINVRTPTTAFVAWPDMGPWMAEGDIHQSPDISEIVQELVNAGGWAPGQAMVFVITGSGRRTAHSFDGAPMKAPRLHVDWSVP